MESFFIRKAEEKDLNAIFELAKMASLYSLAAQAASESGFLVSDYTYEDYQRYLEVAEHFYLTETDGLIVAFVLAFESKNIRNDQIVESLLKYAYTKSFILIKQICVHPKYRRNGLASCLYDYLISIANKQKSSLLAAVVFDPPNIPSIQFHQKLGFKKEIEVLAPDNRYRGIWKYEFEINDCIFRIRLCGSKSSEEIICHHAQLENLVVKELQQ